MSSKRILAVVVLLLLAVTAFVFWRYQSSQTKLTFQMYEGMKMSPSWDIADNILSEPSTTVFSNSLYNNGYITFLHDSGPFTVFLPTDKAYTNLPGYTQQYFRQKDNSGELRQMLLYHVVKGRYQYTDLKDGTKLTTIEGEELTFHKDGQYLMINGNSYIEKYDLNAKNGVIYIITNYLIPPSLLEQ